MEREIKGIQGSMNPPERIQSSKLCSLPSDTAWGLIMQHVQSVKVAVLEGPWPIAEGKKNSSS